MSIEKLVESAVEADAMVDVGSETELEFPVTVNEASVEGDVMLAAAVERKKDEMEEKLKVADAAPLSQVEKLRQMFDQKASRVDEETTDAEVACVAQDTDEGEPVKDEDLAMEQQPTASVSGDISLATMPLILAEQAGGEEQAGAIERVEDAPDSGGLTVDGVVLGTAKPTTVANQLPEAETVDMAPIATVDDVVEVSVDSSPEHWQSTKNKM